VGTCSISAWYRVFKVNKRTLEGAVDRCNGQVVARGFSQLLGDITVRSLRLQTACRSMRHNRDRAIGEER